MDSHTVRQKYLSFFEAQGHAIVPSASLVPENDPTTLFTGSGMQPMVPFLLGEKHPQGTRVADSQKSFRAGDIDDVGDNRHTTFFEMLGNWSFGDYFKEEQLRFIFTFLTDEVGLDPERLYASVFIGDAENNLPRDEVSPKIWQELYKEKGIDAEVVELGSASDGSKKGMQGGRIFYYDAKENWWSRAGVPSNMPAGEPGGPDSEIFYDFGETSDCERCHPACDCGRFMEIGNSVFMEYVKQTDGTFKELEQKNVDFGGGLERIVAAANNTPDVFLIDTLYTIITALEEQSGTSYTDNVEAYRVVADHIRGSVFLINDGVLPSNTDQGYMLRRLLRRAVRYADVIGLPEGSLSSLVVPIAEKYQEHYPAVAERQKMITDTIREEETGFRKTLANGLKQFEKYEGQISGRDAFVLFSTYGFPIELTQELAEERGMTIDMDAYEKEMHAHKKLSQTASEGKFKGGLSDHSDMSIKYHTATHLLNAALHEVLGDHVAQKGSNITPERMRFDFSHPEKLTEEEKQHVTDLVNQKIQEDLPVSWTEMSAEEALATGAFGEFGDKYGHQVKVYVIGEGDHVFSREICGGPHVERTGTLGTFRIAKEKAIAKGIRRIKALLE